MTSSAGYFPCTTRVTSKPEMPGMRTSRINKSWEASSRRAIAASPEVT